LVALVETEKHPVFLVLRQLTPEEVAVAHIPAVAVEVQVAPAVAVLVATVVAVVL
jgi:hypothetical protein